MEIIRSWFYFIRVWYTGGYGYSIDSYTLHILFILIHIRRDNTQGKAYLFSFPYSKSSSGKLPKAIEVRAACTAKSRERKTQRWPNEAWAACLMHFIPSLVSSDPFLRLASKFTDPEVEEIPLFARFLSRDSTGPVGDGLFPFSLFFSQTSHSSHILSLSLHRFHLRMFLSIFFMCINILSK